MNCKVARVFNTFLTRSLENLLRKSIRSMCWKTKIFELRSRMQMVFVSRFSWQKERSRISLSNRFQDFSIHQFSALTSFMRNSDVLLTRSTYQRYRDSITLIIVSSKLWKTFSNGRNSFYDVLNSHQRSEEQALFNEIYFNPIF